MREQRREVASIQATDDGAQGWGEAESVYAEIAELVGGMRVLHLNSGWGAGSEVLAVKARSVTGAEAESERVAYARQTWSRTNLEFIGGDLIRQPEVSGGYEAVVALGLTGQMPNVRQMLSRICQVMEDGGVAWISVEESEEGGSGSATFSWAQYLKGFFQEVEASPAGRCTDGSGRGNDRVFECRHPRRAEQGMTSIVIPVKGLWNYTETCLASISRNTPEPHEIIVVDNGSEDGTAAELAKLGGIRVVKNRANLGFGVASNQGIRESRGEYVLILNNDTLVTPGWLGRMLSHVAKPGVGAVGPMSNHAIPIQQIEFSPQNQDDLNAFAAQRGEIEKGATNDVPYLSGLCLLLRREVIQTVGAFDARFGLGNWEDADLGLRALCAGYSLKVARDVFIHHFGGQTTAAEGINRNDLMFTNWELLKQKWGVEQRPLDELSQERLVEQLQVALDHILGRTYHWQFFFDGSLWGRPADEIAART